jgi:GNAT superfamily N-acetyltransferase
MTAADLPLGLRLSRAAGWNQIETDWQRAFELQPDGCFVAELDRTPIGTTTTCIFGPVAWIAMVLVDESVRRQGVGTELLRYALRFLDDQRIVTVRLDARPAGRPLYERLGFVAEHDVAHYEGTAPLRSEVAWVEDAGTEHWEALAALDETVTGTNRRRLLKRLFTERLGSVRFIRIGRHVGGFLTARPGRTTSRLGPCVAAAEAGPLLLADAWHRHGGQRVSIDIPVPNETARRSVEACGLTVQHTLTRMYRGEPPGERVADLWASSGPEKG